MMFITMTAGEIIDKGLWEQVCTMKGLSEWCVNEGLMTSDEEISFTEEEARELGLMD